MQPFNMCDNFEDELEFLNQEEQAKLEYALAAGTVT